MGDGVAKTKRCVVEPTMEKRAVLGEEGWVGEGGGAGRAGGRMVGEAGGEGKRQSHHNRCLVSNKDSFTLLEGSGTQGYKRALVYEDIRGL